MADIERVVFAEQAWASPCLFASLLARESSCVCLNLFVWPNELQARIAARKQKALEAGEALEDGVDVDEQELLLLEEEEEDDWDYDEGDLDLFEAGHEGGSGGADEAGQGEAGEAVSGDATDDSESDDDPSHEHDENGDGGAASDLGAEDRRLAEQDEEALRRMQIHADQGNVQKDKPLEMT